MIDVAFLPALGASLAAPLMAQGKLRNAVFLGWIYEHEHRQVREQQRPVAIEPTQDALPIDDVRAVPHEVHHVRTVEALALHDEGFLPEKLLDGSDLDGHPKHVGFQRALEPRVVNATDPVAGAENEIHVIARLVRLGQPVREADLDAIAGVAKGAERALQVVASQEQVEILRVPNDAGVLEIRV